MRPAGLGLAGTGPAGPGAPQRPAACGPGSRARPRARGASPRGAFRGCVVAGTGGGRPGKRPGLVKKLGAAGTPSDGRGGSAEGRDEKEGTAGEGGGAAQLWPAGTLGVDVATLQTRSC